MIKPIMRKKPSSPVKKRPSLLYLTIIITWPIFVKRRLRKLLPRIFQTWDHVDLIPKIHISSPKGEKEFRSHADFVDLDFIMPFIKMVKELGQDVDFMIEAKAKDQATLKLVEDMSKIRGFKRVQRGCHRDQIITCIFSTGNG